MLRYFGRLKQRMVVRGLDQDRKLYDLVRSTYDDLHRLNVELHYRKCDAWSDRKR